MPRPPLILDGHTLTENNVDDASQLAPIVAQIESDISKLGVDGAYETADCWDLLEYNAIKGLIPARANAVY